MRLFFLLLPLFFLFTSCSADTGSRHTVQSVLTTHSGKAYLGGVLLNNNAVFSQLSDTDLILEDLWITVPKQLQDSNIYLFTVSGIENKTQKLKYGFVVLDLHSGNPIFSNVEYLKERYVWDDNHYVAADNNGLFFGLYVVDPFNPQLNSGKSDRIQFVYHDGKLQENTGPWHGPAKPEKYIEPEHPGPCYNVADVPACIEEVEQAKAAKRAKRKHKAKPAVSAPVPSATK